MFRRRKTWIDELNDLFKDFNFNSDYLFYPQTDRTGNTEKKNYSTEIGEWEKETFTSNDRSFVQTKIYFTPRGFEEKMMNPENMDLKNQLRIAVENEDFEKAAELRDQIKNLEKNKEEISNLNSELQKAISEQNFERAIEIRDQLKELKS